MKTKRIMLTAVLTLIGAGTAVAIPADPAPKKVRQADGTEKTVYLQGDEFWHQMFTNDGKAVVWNPQTNMLEPDKRTRADYEQAMLRRQAAQQRWQRPVGHATPAGPRHIRINNFPTTGKSKSLVVLLEFSDTRFSSIDDPKDYYHRMLNQRGFTWSNGAIGSAMDFYDQSSNYQFDHEFVVLGPITLDHEATYYGSDTPKQDARAGEMVVEACQKIDDDVDFSEYDYDGDGCVDNIYFFYAGIGQATHPGATDYIWPHSGDLDDDWQLWPEFDGKRIRHYATSNELRYTGDDTLVPLGIGVFVHEFGHVLGLADHYDVAYGLGTFNVKNWDTMANGSHNNDMNCPPLFSAFERAELGWLDYEMLNSEVDSVCTLPPLSQLLPSQRPANSQQPTANSLLTKAYRWSVPGTEGREFFVMENRQQVGFDESLPGHGMVVWHIDIDTAAWQKNIVNVLYNHQRVAIVCADGVESDATREGDPFPGSLGITKFVFNAWDGQRQFALDDVTEGDSLVEFLLDGIPFQLAKPANITATEVADSSFSFSWDAVKDAGSYRVSVMQGTTPIINNKVFNVPEVVKIDGVADNSDYEVSIAAIRGSYESEPATTIIHTNEMAFAKRKPTNLSVTDMTDDGFTAHWDVVHEADDYQVTLYRHDYGTRLTTQGYDFTEKADGLPALWATSSSTYYSVKGYYGENSPSLRFSKDADFLEVGFEESLIQHLSFWMRGSTGEGQLVVEQQKNGEWVSVKAIALQKEAATAETDIDAATKVRLRFERTTGYVVIDDVKAQCVRLERLPVEGKTNLSSGGQLQMSFNGLEKAKYSFRVRALRQGEPSVWSDELQVGVTRQDTIRLGYCNGEVATSTDLQMNGTGWAHVAMRLPATSLAAYQGNAIEAVRVCLLSRSNIDSLLVWVRPTLDGKNLAEGLITSKSAQRVEKGWNQVMLNQSLPVNEQLGEVFVGFSYRQRANVKTVSVVGDALYDTFYLRYQNGEWTDISQLGAVSMEAIVTGENILSHDLGLLSADLHPSLANGTDALQVEAMIQNFGSKAVEGFTITCQTEGVAPITTHIHETIGSTERRKVSFVIKPPVHTDQDNEWTVSITALDNATDGNETNNQARATYSFLKNVLVEEFTTEQCINCPRVAGFLHEALESKADYEERVIAVCHHAGYYTDWLTQPWDEQLTWLYNEGSSLYAPAVMLNRHPVFDSRYSTNSKTPCFIPSSSAELCQYFDYEMETQANAVVGLSLEFSADSLQATAHVSCLHNQHYGNGASRLTLYLVEDNIRAENQIGATGTFMHQHVTRATNNTWGEQVSWTDANRFDYDYTFSIDTEWKREDLQVVALLHRYDGESHDFIDVENAARMRFSTPTAISGTPLSTNVVRKESVFNLSGRRVQPWQKGLHIVRSSDGSVRKVMMK